MAAKYAVGIQTLQMNRDHDYGGVVANQLQTFAQLGLFTGPLPAEPAALPRLADYRDDSQDINFRARAYLHANCAHCHRRWGGGNAEFQLLATLDLGDMGIVGVRPGQGTLNIPNAKIVAANDPYRSALFYRISTVGPGRMPRIGSNLVDGAGVKLLHDWIAQLPAAGLLGDASSRAALKNAGSIQQLRSAGDASTEALHKQLDPLLASTSTALQLAQALADESFPAKVRDWAAARVAQVENTDVRDLYERFLPEERRIKRLGNVIKPEQILALPGDIERGRKLFFETSGVQCKTCHRIGGKGTEVGPDLDGIGKKYARAQILENILDPSKQIDPKYVTYLVETKRGQIFTGLLVSKDVGKVVLKDAANKRIEVPADGVEVIAPQQKSLMPELLLRDFTAEQVADLTTYLSSLK